MEEINLDPNLNKTGDIWHICIEVPLVAVLPNWNILCDYLCTICMPIF